jgi:dihydrofolate reductase
MLSIVVATAENHVIGNENKLIWHLPADLKYFKSLTSGHCVIMGRKTYDSIGKPLPNRVNIVISRDKNLEIEGCLVAHSLEEAIEVAQSAKPNDEIFVIGGANVYEQALRLTSKIYLTKVHENFEGDTYFRFPESEFIETSRLFHLPDEKNKYPYSFLTYIKLF